jgi:hypothetical protein
MFQLAHLDQPNHARRSRAGASRKNAVAPRQGCTEAPDHVAKGVEVGASGVEIVETMTIRLVVGYTVIPHLRRAGEFPEQIEARQWD